MPPCADHVQQALRVWIELHHLPRIVSNAGDMVERMLSEQSLDELRDFLLR